MARPVATANNWAALYDALSANESALEPAEWEQLAQAAWFLGRGPQSERAWDRAYHDYLESGDADGAVRCVFWAGYTQVGPSPLKAGAWMSLLFELCDREPVGARSMAVRMLCQSVTERAAGSMSQSIASAQQAVELSEREGDIDTSTLARLSLALSYLADGQFREASTCMDQMMLRISAGAVTDRVAGPAYCAVIASCLGRSDIERARVWTGELNDWCDAQRGLEPFRGQCTVHRAEVLRLGGEWQEARSLLRDVLAYEHRDSVLSQASYAAGELHRLAGHRAEAESAYELAARLGRDPQPGLALLRRDQGRLDSARAGAKRALASTLEPAMRGEVLAAIVEFDLEADDLSAAAEASATLETLARDLRTDYLVAAAASASGAVATASGHAEAAMRMLRAAWSAWQRLGLVYHSSLTRIRIGEATRALGDEEGAQLEFDAARSVLDALGAVPDLARLERLARPGRSGPASALTPRELDVLRCIAQGMSNRSIANRLFVSERTVATHVAHILAKLDLANRAAATAFAFSTGLVTAS
jgi:DNA-binding CsgD family transcriptional regulator